MPAPHRILLVPEARSAGSPGLAAPTAPKIRKYSLARIRVADTRGDVQPRFAHLRRTYD